MEISHDHCYYGVQVNRGRGENERGKHRSKLPNVTSYYLYFSVYMIILRFHIQIDVNESERTRKYRMTYINEEDVLLSSTNIFLATYIHKVTRATLGFMW